ncbi:aspartate aminotransferase family protein, partial [Streptomyces sp. SID7982]|nr:aspartate aminotransferase family protein [Streptomyces sp. SID7982]
MFGISRPGPPTPESQIRTKVAYSYEAPVSQSLFDRASVVTPGGVNSPVR